MSRKIRMAAVMAGLLILAGCGDSDHPKSDHPKPDDKSKGAQPDHPKSEHPK